MARSTRYALRVLAVSAMVGGVIFVSSGSADDSDGAREEEAVEVTPVDSILETLDPRTFQVQADVAFVPLEDGGRAVLTLDTGLQAHATSILERYDVPFGAIVAMEPSSGRVLAYVSHSSQNPDAPDLVRDPTPPTASVFKIITGSALVDAGVSVEERVCYAGGASRLRERHLEDAPSDRQCATLREAMGGSINAVFAKLADRHLDVATMERYASAFAFQQRLPFDLPTLPSPAEVPAERLEFARTAAGFWHMHMSPLHGAFIGATIANGGEMPRGAVVERIEDADHNVLHEHTPSMHRRVLSRATATATGAMMRRTVTHGTSRRTFFDRQGNAFLPGISVAGKTGTLHGENPFRGYTWWVGFAPADEPTIAVAALIVNSPRWRIKANFAARETLRYYLVERPRELARASREASADDIDDE